MQIVPSTVFKLLPVVPAGPIHMQPGPVQEVPLAALPPGHDAEPSASHPDQDAQPTALHSDQSTTPAPIPLGRQDLTKLLPTTLLNKIIDHLPAPEIDLLHQTSKFNRQEIREAVRQKLKPEFRDCSDPVKLFKDPSKRLDHFIPIDDVGRFHLYRLGIPLPYLMDKIQNRQLTLAQALEIVSVNRAKIDEAAAKDPINRLLLDEDNESGISVKYVVCGLLKLEDYLKARDNLNVALRWPGVVDHFDRGIITVAHLNRMREWSARLLGCEGIAKALARGDLTVEQIMATRQPKGSVLENCSVLKYLNNGKLSLAQANQLRKKDCEDLHSPNLQRYLDRGIMTMDQLLGHTSRTRRLLKVLPA